MVYGRPIKNLQNCRYCKEQPGLIYPEYAQKMEVGNLKCGPCVFEDFVIRKIRVLDKDNPQVKKMFAEKQKEIDSWSNTARRYNKMFNLPEDKVYN